MLRTDVIRLLDSWLQPQLIQDYCPNGLQVEGREDIRHVITGVTASQNLIDAAIQAGADTLLVHHGYFWKGEDVRVIGMKQRRLKALLAHDMNLIGYHLPLDIHPDFGNNAEMLRLMGAEEAQGIAGVKPDGILMMGTLPEAKSGYELADHIETLLERTLVAVELSEQPIRRIAICTGGGQSFIEQAVAAGADAFITGEVSEQTIHVARECGIQFFAAGHHATERYGVRALGERLAAETDIQVDFLDMDNPA